MASGLAIDTSDVDLVVQGLSFNGDRDIQLHYMRNLANKLEYLKSKHSL